MIIEDNQERRRQESLVAEADIKNTSWAYATTGLFKQLLRSRYSASIVDISEGGIGILTNAPIAKGENIDVTVCYRNFKPFVASCRARSCRVFDEVKLDNQTLTYYKVGLQLELCTKETMDSIRKVVKLISHQSKESLS